MKGQLTIQYLISFVVFIGLVTYIYFTYSQNVPDFLDEVRKETYRSEVFQISEMLINDKGKPDPWTKENVERIGLSDSQQNKKNFISKSKIDILKTYDCFDWTDYDDLKNKIGTSENFTLFIFDVNLDTAQRENLFLCFPPANFTTSIRAKITRYATYVDNGTVKVAEIIVEL